MADAVDYERGGLADVLDRVLDKGIIIDAYANVSLAGVAVVAVEARIIVASCETYLQYADRLAVTFPAARPSQIAIVHGGTPAGEPHRPVL